MFKKLKWHRLIKGIIILLSLSNAMGVIYAQKTQNKKNQIENRTIYDKYGRPIGTQKSDGTITDKSGRTIMRIQDNVITDKDGRPKAKIKSSTITDQSGRNLLRIQDNVITDKEGRPKARINSSTITDKSGRPIATIDSTEIKINNKTKYRKQ